MSRFICCLGFGLLLGCSGSHSAPEASIPPPPLEFNRAEALKTLQDQAHELGHAIVAGDNEKMVDGTHPKIVALAGGREQMIRLLELTAKGMQSAEGSIQDVQFEEPSGLEEGGDQLFGIVPFTLEIMVGQVHSSRKSFFLGVSNDGGDNWKFVEAGQINSAKVKDFFPNYPEKLQLPEKLPLIVNDTE